MTDASRDCLSSLLIKEARFARVLHLWFVDGFSTHAIAMELDISEDEVCHLIEEAERASARCGMR